MVDIAIGTLPQDPAFPSLAVAADPVAMLRLLEPYFDGVRLLQLRVARFAYKPGRQARFCYRLKLRALDTGLKTHHVLHGSMEPGRTGSSHDAQAGHWVQPRYGPAFVDLESLGLVLWGFPNDPNLGDIARVTDPKKLLARLRTQSGLGDLVGATCQSSIVKYVPGRRLVMRHKLRVGDRRFVLYGKTYAHDRGQAIFEIMKRLWTRCSQDPNALLSPEPLAYLQEERTLLLRGLPGLAASATLGNGDLEDRMRRIGHGLATLHTCPIDHLEAWTETDVLEGLEVATQELLAHDPDLAPRIERLLQLVQTHRPGPDPSGPVAIHGAFRFTQLLSMRDRLALVDFDGVGAGHPMYDVGSFVAHLEYVATKGELDTDTARRAVRSFLEAYRTRAPWGIQEPALQWYTGLLLVSKHAKKCVKRQKLEGAAKIQHFLGLAETILSGERPLHTHGDDS